MGGCRSAARATTHTRALTATWPAREKPESSASAGGCSSFRPTRPTALAHAPSTPPRDPNLTSPRQPPVSCLPCTSPHLDHSTPYRYRLCIRTPFYSKYWLSGSQMRRIRGVPSCTQREASLKDPPVMATTHSFEFTVRVHDSALTRTHEYKSCRVSLAESPQSLRICAPPTSILLRQDTPHSTGTAFSNTSAHAPAGTSSGLHNSCTCGPRLQYGAVPFT